LFNKSQNVVWLSAGLMPEVEKMGHPSTYFFPVKTFAEKSGTFVNFEGREQRFEKVELFVEQALSLSEMARILDGQPVHLDQVDEVARVQNEFVHLRGQL